MQVVRGIAGDLVEEVKLIDDFTHPKTVRAGALRPPVQACTYQSLRRLPLAQQQFKILMARFLPAPARPRLQGRTSNCYRIAYRSMDRSLTDEEINALQEEVRRWACGGVCVCVCVCGTGEARGPGNLGCGQGGEECGMSRAMPGPDRHVHVALPPLPHPPNHHPPHPTPCSTIASKLGVELR